MRSRLPLRLLGLLPFFPLAATAHADVVPQGLAGKAIPETGPASSSATNLNWQVGGTDLGIPWFDTSGRLLLAFGDTWTGSFTNGPTPDTHQDSTWRRGGTLAISNDRNPADGISFTSMLSDAPGHAEPMLVPFDAEFTAIPTAGASLDGYDFVHFMSIAGWGSGAGAGEWRVNGSALAWRSTGTNTQFSRDAPNALKWGPDSNFAQAAFTVVGDYLYMFGTPSGRSGGVKLARAHGGFAAGVGVFEYWTGTGWAGDESRAVFVVPPPVSELSVQYNPTFDRFVMTYFDEPRATIVLRDAPSIEGPYTYEKPLANGASYAPNHIYGGLLYPFTAAGAPFGSGTDAYLNMTQWEPYNVSLLRAPLTQRNVNDELVTDGGFEEQLAPGASAPWFVDGDPSRAGIDICAGNAHTPSNNAWIRAADTAWHGLRQEIAVSPGADYRVTFWVRTSAAFSGAFAGLRTVQPPGENCAPCAGTSCPSGGVSCWKRLPATPARTPIDQRSFGPSTSYTPVSFVVNAGANSLAEVFVGFNGSGSDQWVQVDDVSVQPLQRVRDGGFETSPSNGISAPWSTEGTGGKGVDLANGLARSGENDGWIRTSNPHEWNALTQVVPVDANAWHHLTGHVQTSSTLATGYFGVRGVGGAILSQTSFGASTPYEELDVWFYAGTNTSVTLFAGFWSSGQDAWMRLDDVAIE
ncbi:MAG TPA: DUF4185 domain-containing protein [Polyangiaceae bacterium]|jgi:hypothetical protein